MPETYIIQGYATAMQEEAVCVVFNNETDDARRLLTVRGIEIRPSSPTGSATVPGSSNLRRITAAETGTGDTITAYPHNLAAAAVPSQVVIQTNSIVTASAAAPFRRRVGMTPVGIATGNSYLGNVSCMADPLASAATWSAGSGAVAGVTLAQGEGLACVESAQEAQFAFGVQLVFSIAGSTYSAAFYANASNGGEACWSIMNGAGSGVTITINRVLMSDVGTSNTSQLGVDAPYIRYSRIHGYDGGLTVGAVALNAGNTPPGALVSKRNTLQQRLTVSSYESGSQSFSDHAFPNGTAAQTALVRKWGTWGHRSPYQGAIGGPNVAMADGNLMFPAPDFGPSMGIEMTDARHSGIVLRPQEGFAAIAGNISGYADYYFRARVVHTAPPVAGGSNTYARARVVNG